MAQGAHINIKRWPERGEIYLVNFEPAIGAEIQKVRPAVVIQNDFSNSVSPLTIVAAVTSKLKEKFYPDDVRVVSPEGGLESDSRVLLRQIRTIDKRRLVKRLGRLTEETMERVDRALRISLGLAEI